MYANGHTVLKKVVLATQHVVKRPRSRDAIMNIDINVMANSIYQINKGINQSIEFKGLKAQYIWYLGGGVVVLLIVFAVMYTIGLPAYLCMGIILTSGIFLVMRIYGMSNKYGEHGLMKALARKQVPKLIKSRSRKVFMGIKHKQS